MGAHAWETVQLQSVTRHCKKKVCSSLPLKTASWNLKWPMARRIKFSTQSWNLLTQLDSQDFPSLWLRLKVAERHCYYSPSGGVEHYVFSHLLTQLTERHPTISWLSWKVEYESFWLHPFCQHILPVNRICYLGFCLRRIYKRHTALQLKSQLTNVVNTKYSNFEPQPVPIQQVPRHYLYAN